MTETTTFTTESRTLSVDIYHGNEWRYSDQWTHVGSVAYDIHPETSPKGAADHLAEVVFAEWNNGSGQESDAFQAAGVRSLSVGDVLVFPELETTLLCASFGWEIRPALSPEEVTA